MVLTEGARLHEDGLNGIKEKRVWFYYSHFKHDNLRNVAVGIKPDKTAKKIKRTRELPFSVEPGGKHVPQILLSERGARATVIACCAEAWRKRRAQRWLISKSIQPQNVPCFCKMGAGPGGGRAGGRSPPGLRSVQG